MSPVFGILGAGAGAFAAIFVWALGARAIFGFTIDRHDRWWAFPAYMAGEMVWLACGLGMLSAGVFLPLSAALQ